MTVYQKNYTDDELGYPTEGQGRIPSFANRDEEAQFWTDHDITEFAGSELQAIEVAIGPELANRLTVRLDPDDRAELTRHAKVKGIGPSTLARMWLKDRLREEAKVHTR